MNVKSDAPHGPPEPEPPRRDFKFKPTEFETTNRPADDTPGNARIDVKELNRQAAAPPPANPPAPAENEVHALLRANLARAQAKGENEVIPQPRRPSRRKRDFWLLFIGGNLLFAGAVGALDKNAVTVIFGFSGMVFFSLGLIWVMWVVMDDY